MPIRILPPEVANQIAAGEVVERPSSVVKELTENSLDAGASDIRIEIREGGRRLVRAQDDGCGIPAAEVGLAFQRHATSKISSAADLDRITTLGFRGEALASIGSVAQVTLLSRSRGEEVGVLLRIAEGQEIAREAKGAAVGTVVTVEHLFANVPARLKFLKQPATEAGHIQQIVTRYALAYPERRFSLVSDGKLVFQSTGSGKLYDVLIKVYGLEIARLMLRVGHNANLDPEAGSPQPSDDRLSFAASPIISGYTGAPALHRNARSYITLFVNRRWFQDASVAFSVIQAYHTLLPVGRYPVAVLFIEIDPAEVDVNVHPAKAEVRFRDSRAVFSAVQRAVRDALIAYAPIPQTTLGAHGGGATGQPEPWEGARNAAFGGLGWPERREALLSAGGRQHHLFSDETIAPPGQAGGIARAGAEREPSDDRLSPAGAPPAEAAPPPAPALRPLLPLLRVVGQLAATYIVAEGPDGMYLIDQHAAHERILYEQMLAQFTGQTLSVQPLLEPTVLDLNPEQAATVAEELETLNQLGIAIEPFGGASYLVRSLPAMLSGQNPQAALAEVVDGLAANTDPVEGTREARLITLICKRAAVKGGHPLSMAEMQELVRRLEACRSPRTCPHGRPTMIHVSADELARQFGRV